MEVVIVKQHWASLKVTLILLSVCALPLAPELPTAFVLALTVSAVLAVAPTAMRWTLRAYRLVGAPVVSARTPEHPLTLWRVFRPVAPGAPGAVRSRAPSRGAAALG